MCKQLISVQIGMWILLGIVGGGKSVYSQERPFIRVLYAIDWQEVSSAEIALFTANGELLTKGITDTRGRWMPTLSLAEGNYVVVTHPDYEEVKVGWEQVVKQGYTLFFESRIFELQEVVFTANKYRENKEDIPVQIEVIKAADIQLRNPGTAATLLEQSGKVFVQRSQMGGGSPNLRGFEANKVLLVIDGVRMNNAIYRGGHLQNVISLDPNMIERTEVMFGPGSVMYGSDALGGVMHFYSRTPAIASGDSIEVKANFMARYASANHEKTLHTDVNIGLEKFASLTSFSVSDFDDLRMGGNRSSTYPDFGKRLFYAERINGQDVMRPNDKENIQRFSGYRQYDFMQKLHFLPNSRLTHTLNFQYSTTSDVPRYDRLSQIEDDVLRFADWHYGPQERLMATYTLKHFAASPLYDRMSLIAAFQDIEESRFSRRFEQNELSSRMESVQVYSVNLDANKIIHKNHELAYGMEAIWNEVGSTAFSEHIETHVIEPLDTRYPDGGSSMRLLAAYLTDRWEISPKWVLTGGARFSDVKLAASFSDKSFFSFLPDIIEQNSRAASGNIGLVYRPSRSLRLSGMAATGFRAPNIDDLGKTFDSSPGTVIIPNPDVRPEYTYNSELTISQQIGKGAKAEVTGFYTLYDDALVVRDFTADGEDSVLYEGVQSKVQAVVNAGRAYIVGVNVNLSAQLNKNWRIEQTLTYTQGQDISNDVPLDHIPPLFGRTSIKYQRRHFQGEILAAFNGKKRLERYSPSGEDNLVFATPEGMPGWWTLNLRSSYAINSQFSMQANLENILDTHYRVFASGISSPGRNLILALRTHF